MLVFDVPDMTCSHCAGTIQKALAVADPQAEVAIDVQAHRVRVRPASAAPDVIEAAIRDAGYTPAPTAG